ncbi:hypothetical protein TCAL_03914 [Tigriopus californicus]|uniref:Alpha N-terminal protein methyltransferase 1 n=1 Tax=Tigriopus californicus TaxID=6832 RepID=A0A553NCF5_TIGCA|nr:hypothetical protein TCAL_03914 [Tigriopus californicus]|eukprot:TCALIF_03914-PA protein Name:"Similar to ntmt1 N-terminal Xaa-Pro-Lys N-methyltransferase 1 (Danio rerio)" AED:0.17 eAED:0.23 QI:0/0.5/0.33/1/1/1/3/30/242
MPLKVAGPGAAAPSQSGMDGIDYELGADYWSKVDPTIDGMLGGFAQISPLDIEGSSSPSTGRALDCGAGIGRVTKYLLQRHFQTVDMVEQDAKFLDHSRAYLGPTSKVDQRFCSGLQSFTPQSAHYDVIWSQWVLGHLADSDLVAFFQRCARGLKANGVLIVKENTTSSDTVEQDPQDGSVTRPDALLKSLFAQADLVLIKDLQQLKFPAELYPVKMYALRPKTASDSPDEAKLKAVGMLPD